MAPALAGSVLVSTRRSPLSADGERDIRPRSAEKSALGAGNDHVDVPRAALAADQALVPVIDGRLGAVVLGHLSRVGLGAIPAVEAPDQKAHFGGGGVAERHRRAAVRFQRSEALSTSDTTK